MMRFKLFGVLIALLLVLPLVFSSEQIIANSRDWRDVFSVMMYGQTVKMPTQFLTSTNHAELIFNSIPKNDSLVIFSSQSSPFVANYQAFARGQGYAVVDETSSDSLNLDLAKKLTAVNRFIIIDDAYGYNAIAAASYAAVDNYYILFANARNIGDVDSFLSSKRPASIILFGQLDAQVKSTLAKYNPVIINKGDRFEDNMAMIDRYQQIRKSKQVVLTNGEFIEQSLLSGDDPVLFIGKTNVPDKVKAYISNSSFDVAILVGNELIGVATYIRRQIGISVFVKFARGSRAPSGPISEVEDLDRFPMPSYQLSLSVDSAVYNTGTSTLEVTYKNNVALATYFSSTITITPDNKTLEDKEAVFIDGSAFKTVLYNTLRDGSPLTLQALQAQAEIATFYGEGPNALENSLITKLNISRITILDESNIELADAMYDISAGRFYITVKNVGPTDVYVRPEVVEVLVNGEKVTKAATDTTFLVKGASAQIPIRLALSKADILDNTQVKVRAYYGVRENALVKIITGDFAMKTVTANYVLYAIIGVVAVLLILLVVIRKKCKTCNEKNMLHRRTCIRCHSKFGKKK
jgi:archaellum component FlaF (FlaF/FlaG flagellin family)